MPSARATPTVPVVENSVTVPWSIRDLEPSLTAPLPASADRWIDRTIAEMPLRDQVAQMVMVWVLGDYTSTTDSSFVRASTQVSRERVGGVIMSLGSPIEVAEKVNALQRLAPLPLIVGSDVEPGLGRLEGGVFAPGLLAGGNATVLPSNMAIGATGSRDAARTAGRITGRESRAIGIHLAFAPAVDVNNNPANPVINVRSFGEDPAKVSELGAAFIEGVQSAGVMATAKHFPGHGDTETDSHLALPVINASRTRLDSIELAPFRAAIGAGVAVVMSAHIALPAVAGDSTPATLVPAVLTGLLRDTLGFRGLVITDAMDMRGIGAGFSIESSAVLAVKAGADILLMPPDVPLAINAVVAAVERGEIPAERIATSVRRILEYKLRTGAIQRPLVPLDSLREVVGSAANRAEAQAVADGAVALIRNDERLLPLNTGAPTLVLTFSGENDLAAGRVFTAELRSSIARMRSARINPGTPRSRLDSLLQPNEQVVVATFVRTIEGEGRFAVGEHIARWIDSVASVRPVTVVAFANPYVLREFPWVGSYAAAFGRGEAVERAAAKSMTARQEFRGIPPVSLPGFFNAGEVRVTSSQVWLNAIADTARKVLARAVADSVFPGAIAIIGRRNGEMTYVAEGRIDWSADAPAPDLNTRWDIASLTKVVGMTTAMMQLVEQGRVQLDAPVQRYLPEWQGQWKERVTVRNLLAHNSGLPAYRELYKEVQSAEEAMQLVYATPLEAAPATRYVYSDLGAILLGQIVERVSGTTLDAYLERNVFKPLGMSATRYHPSADEIARVAPTEMDPWRGRHLRGEVHDENAYRLGGVSAHAGLFSTGSDLARFARMMLNGGELAGARVLRPQTIADFTRVQDSTFSHRALGWETPNGTNSAGTRMKRPAYGHTGFTGTSIWIDPANDVFVILLTNRVNPSRANSRIGPVRIGIADLVQGAIQGTVGPSSTARGMP